MGNPVAVRQCVLLVSQRRAGAAAETCMEITMRHWGLKRDKNRKPVVVVDNSPTRKTHVLLIAREVIGCVERVGAGQRRFRVSLYDAQGCRDTIYKADTIEAVEKAMTKKGYRIRPIHKLKPPKPPKRGGKPLILKAV